MKPHALVFAAIAALAPLAPRRAHADDAPPVDSRPVLALDAAIARGLAASPGLRGQRARNDASAARIDETSAARRPSLSAGASVSTGNKVGAFASAAATARASVNASWLLYDFGQTAASIDAARATARAGDATLARDRLDVVNAVETAYHEAVARRRLVEVARDALVSQARRLDQATRFVAAGSRAPIEVAQARTQVASARTTLVRAENAAETALASLDLAMGGWDGAPFQVAATWPGPTADEDAPRTQLVDAARRTRPELAAQRLTIEASEHALAASRLSLRPELTAQAGLDATTDLQSTPEPGWSASLSLSWTLFDGGRHRAQVRAAVAARAVAAAELDQLELGLRVDITSAQLAIRAGKALAVSAAEATSAARAQLALAEKRYLDGAGSGIELADAQSAVVQTAADEITAQWELATARARLRRVLGR